MSCIWCEYLGSKGMRIGSGECFAVMNFMIWTVHIIYSTVREIKLKIRMGRTYSKKRRRWCFQNFNTNLQERDFQGGLAVDGNSILENILNKQDFNTKNWTHSAQDIYYWRALIKVTHENYFQICSIEEQFTERFPIRSLFKERR